VVRGFFPEVARTAAGSIAPNPDDWRAALTAAGLMMIGTTWWDERGDLVIWHNGGWFRDGDPNTYATEAEAARAWLAAREVKRG
jgi:hypothetical protein